MSKIELKLGRELWKRGYRYRKNDKTIFGKPDFVLKSIKLLFFVIVNSGMEGFGLRGKMKLKTNVTFWHKKIEENIKRDRIVNKKLIKEGWKIVRFWGKDIEKNVLYA